MASELDLRHPLRVHVIGIGGAGMSAIAIVLQAMGHTVSGSDLKDGPSVERLRGLGIAIAVGHAPANLGNAEVVAISTAIPQSNVEVIAAHEQGVPVYRRAEMLAAITTLRKTAAVSGTHGKTTTSSMLAIVMSEAKIRPSFIIGGEVNEIGTNATWDEGEWLVVEADESDGTFLELDTSLAIVTSVEADHLEHYGSFETLSDAFRQFLNGEGRSSVVCVDDENAAALAPSDAITYGFSDNARLQLSRFGGGRSNISFNMTLDGVDLGEFALPLAGKHNALNAGAAIGAAHVAGIEMDVVRQALSKFAGVARRFEFRGEREGVTFVDDYAHLPTEVRAAIAAARRGGWGRVVCVFQPHRYSRTQALADQFAHAFDESDLVVITDIYSSGEMPRPGVSAQLIVDVVKSESPTTTVDYVGPRGDLVNYLATNLRPGDCCLTLGAGDLTSLPDEMLALSTW